MAKGTIPSFRRRTHDSSWDFRKEDTKEYSHCFHRYPAQMIPQVARRLIAQYGIKNGMLFDPYCGSGTSLVEALVYGMNCVGFDINPLATLISRAKTHRFDLTTLNQYVSWCDDLLMPLNLSNTERRFSSTVPSVVNIKYWFPPESIERLGRLRTIIDTIDDPVMRDFFAGTFSETVRESSYTRAGEFKLFRIPREKIPLFAPDVYALFRAKLRRNFNGVVEFLRLRQPNTCRVLDANATKDFPLSQGSVQLVVTSPPYGDSRTTVAYGQFSTLALEWLGNDGARKIDRSGMGGTVPANASGSLPSTLRPVLKKISTVDKRRATEVEHFYADLRLSINGVSRTLCDDGFACYVVGNRTVKGVTLPTDRIVAEMFMDNGLAHVQTFVRKIPNKTMPSRNSPSNVKGAVEKTMTEEYVVVMKKS